MDRTTTFLRLNFKLETFRSQLTCSLSLIYGQEPPIDYNLLESKELFLLGKPIKFRR